VGQEQAALDLHQRRRHDEKLAGHIEIELLHRVQHLDILLHHRLDRNVVDIELILSDQEKKQIERALENGQFDAGIGIENHGVTSLGSGKPPATEKSRSASSGVAAAAETRGEKTVAAMARRTE
jgi:hypothetical protein